MIVVEELSDVAEGKTTELLISGADQTNLCCIGRGAGIKGQGPPHTF